MQKIIDRVKNCAELPSEAKALVLKELYRIRDVPAYRIHVAADRTAVALEYVASFSRLSYSTVFWYNVAAILNRKSDGLSYETAVKYFEKGVYDFSREEVMPF